MGCRALRAAADHQRHLGANRVLLELVVFDLRLLLQLAVVVNLHALGLAGAVVGNGHERPRVGLELVFRHHLQGIVRVGMDKVHRDPPALHPDIPAAEGVCIIHAGDHGIGRVVGRNADPEGHAERLVVFEIATTRKFAGLAVEQNGGHAVRAGLPGGRRRERKFGLLAGEQNAGGAPLPFVEGQIDERSVLWQRLGDDRGSGRFDP